MTESRTLPRTAAAPARSAAVRGSGLRLAVTTAVVVVVLSVLTPLLAGVPSGADAVWWPAAGAALALAVRFPSRRWWCVAGTLVGSAVASRLPGGDPATATVFASAQALQCAVGSWLTCVLSRGESARLRRAGDAWRLTAGAVAGVVAGALLLLPSDPRVLVEGAPAQLLGVLLVAPLLLAPGPTAASPDRRSRAAVAEWALVLVLSAGLAWAVFWNADPGPWAFLVVVPVLWGAARLGVGRAVSCLLVVAVVAVAGNADGRGVEHQLGAAERGVVLQALLLTTGAVALVMSLVVRSRERAVVQAGRREELFRRTFDDALLGVALLRLRADGTAVVARANDRLRSMVGADVPVGSDWSEQVHPEHRDAFVDAVVTMVADVAAGSSAQWSAELQHGPEGAVWLELAVAAWPTSEGDDGEVAAVVQVADVTQRRLAQRRLREAALHDALTGLPNRVLLEDRLRHALTAAGRSGCEVALLYCDLDDFKPVNDTGGHAAGDHVLIEVAERLAAAVRPGDTVARLGGDEFAVVCPDLPDADAARAVAARIVEAVAEPFEVAGWSFPLGISVGLALADAGADAQRVLQDADAAMYRVKTDGKAHRAAAREGAVVDLRSQPRTAG